MDSNEVVGVNGSQAIDLDFDKDISEVSCDLDKVYSNLKTGLVESDDVDLGCYLIAYKELYK